MTIALVNAGDLKVLLVHEGPFGITGAGGRGNVYMQRVWGIVLG